MNGNNPCRSQHLFIVRLWNESTTLPDQWRGSVEYTLTGQKFYFTSMEDMNDFIKLCLNGSCNSDS